MRRDLYTKTVLTVAAIILAGIAGKATAQQKKVSEPLQTPLMDNEAKAFARRVWDKVLRRCPDPPRGDSYFSYSVSAALHFVGDRLYWKADGSDRPLEGFCCITMTEIKGLGFHTDAGLLSDADRLNGITWKGGSNIEIKAYRQREQGRSWGPWGEWKSDTLYGAVSVIRFRNINGAWQFDGSNLLGKVLPVEELAGMPGCSDLQAPIAERFWRKP